MKILAVRSVLLGEESMNAWRSQGVRFVKRERDANEINEIVEKYGYDTILNLGSRSHDTLDFAVETWNETDTINAVSRPEDLRETMDEFLPDNDKGGPHWHKRSGHGGSGVRFCEEACEVVEGDSQRHVDGTEFRVLTVGDIVVQASKKTNLRWIDGKHVFDWDWIGVGGVRTNGIIPLIKQAVVQIPAYKTSVLGWDIIVGDRPYVIEINTSPGVNAATAERIVRAISQNS